MKSTNCFLNGTRFDHASGRDFLLSAAVAARNSAECGKIIEENFGASYEAG